MSFLNLRRRRGVSSVQSVIVTIGILLSLTLLISQSAVADPDPKEKPGEKADDISIASVTVTGQDTTLKKKNAKTNSIYVAAVKRPGQYITMEVHLEHDIEEANLPANTVEWTAGIAVPGAGQLHHRFPLDTPIKKTITVNIGNKSYDVVLYVVWVDAGDFKVNGTFADYSPPNPGPLAATNPNWTDGLGPVNEANGAAQNICLAQWIIKPNEFIKDANANEFSRTSIEWHPRQDIITRSYMLFTQDNTWYLRGRTSAVWPDTTPRRDEDFEVHLETPVVTIWNGNQDSDPYDDNNKGYLFGMDAPGFTGLVTVGNLKFIMLLNAFQYITVKFDGQGDHLTCSDRRPWHSFRAVKKEGATWAQDNAFLNEIAVGNTFYGTIPMDHPTIATTTLPNGTNNVAYDQQIEATGGNTDKSWRTYGPDAIPACTGLPPGLSISETGRLTGTPTKAGTFTFWVQVYKNDLSDNGIELLTLVIAP